MVLSLSAIEYSLQYEKIIVLNLGCILDTEGENYTDETPEILSILASKHQFLKYQTQFSDYKAKKG